MRRRKQPYDEDDVIIEYWYVGNAVRVSAMEPRTLTEVTIVGPSGASEAELKHNVLRKLEYVLAKEGKGRWR